MCDQNRILALLVPLNAVAEPLSATTIMVRLRTAPTRKQVLSALGKLMQKKLVKRANKKTAFDHVEPEYQATKSGVDFVRAGKRVTSGPNRPLTGVRKPRDNAFRQRFWNAFRIQKKATLPELIEIAREKGDGNVDSNALRYMKFLERAGVATRLPTKERGHALTSPGHHRFALLRDLGPFAPQAAKPHLINLNATTDAEKFIPYREGK